MSPGFIPQIFIARNRISRSSENRLGIAIVRPRRSVKVLDRTILPHHQSAAVAMPQIHDLDRHALRRQCDGHRRDDEGRLHLVGDQRFLHLRKTLEHARQKQLAVLREFRNVIGDRTGQLAGHGKIRDDNLPLRRRTKIVQHRVPVHVQVAMQRRDQHQPSARKQRQPCS